ncbi:hypothetical protein CC79DRAFT_691092 [Sarocladium strictum]
MDPFWISFVLALSCASQICHNHHAIFRTSAFKHYQLVVRHMSEASLDSPQHTHNATYEPTSPLISVTICFQATAKGLRFNFATPLPSVKRADQVQGNLAQPHYPSPTCTSHACYPCSQNDDVDVAPHELPSLECQQPLEAPVQVQRDCHHQTVTT